MSSADWRSPDAYENLRSLDAPGFAWEYLRRNPEFLRDHSKLVRATRIGALDRTQMEAFVQRWGLRFHESEPDGNPGFVPWLPATSPSVIALTRLPADLGDPKFQLPPLSLEPGTLANGAVRPIKLKGVVFLVNIDTTGADPPAVLLPLDRLFDIRAVAAIRLWRALTGRNPGPDPAALSKTRRDRLILALRALDGRLEGASYREVADGLFGVGEISGSGWKSHDMRDRTIRLVRFGINMMKRDYRRLLLHPYRRR